MSQLTTFFKEYLLIHSLLLLTCLPLSSNGLLIIVLFHFFFHCMTSCLSMQSQTTQAAQCILNVYPVFSRPFIPLSCCRSHPLVCIFLLSTFEYLFVFHSSAFPLSSSPFPCLSWLPANHLLLLLPFPPIFLLSYPFMIQFAFATQAACLPAFP